MKLTGGAPAAGLSEFGSVVANRFRPPLQPAARTTRTASEEPPGCGPHSQELDLAAVLSSLDPWAQSVLAGAAVPLEQTLASAKAAITPVVLSELAGAAVPLEQTLASAAAEIQS